MANWSNPTLTSLYTDFLSELKARDEDLAKQFDGQTVSNLATGSIRWSSTANRWQKWTGSAWGELTTTYALTGLSTTGNANIGGTLDVTGNTTLAVATATTPIVSDNSTRVATTAYVRSQAYATLSSPTFTGTPTAPTAPLNTNSTQIATTAFVQSEIANDAPTKSGTGATGTWGIDISGSAETLATGRTISLTGDVTGTSGSFNGSSNVSIAATVSDNSHNHSTSTLTNIESNQYTPTLTNNTNLTASSVVTNGFFYIRVGNIVTVSGKVTITATTANTTFILILSLPISPASNFAGTNGAAGCASDDLREVQGRVQSVASSVTVALRGRSSSTTAGREIGLSFSYVL